MAEPTPPTEEQKQAQQAPKSTPKGNTKKKPDPRGRKVTFMGVAMYVKSEGDK